MGKVDNIKTGEKFVVVGFHGGHCPCPYFIRRKTWTQTMGHKANVDPPWRKNAGAYTETIAASTVAVAAVAVKHVWYFVA